MAAQLATKFAAIALAIAGITWIVGQATQSLATAASALV